LEATLKYITSKLNYKHNNLLDVYTLNIRRNTNENRETLLREALEFLLANFDTVAYAN